MKMVDDDVLVKVIVGESTEEETRSVTQWLAVSEENRSYFEGLKKVWESSLLLRTDEEVDVNKAWTDFQTRIPKMVPLKPQTQTWWMAAAALVLVAAGFWVFSTLQTEDQYITSVAGDSVKKDVLPDGTTVTLNRNAILHYSTTLTKDKQREVRLDGEAFFDVMPDKTKPFVISTGETTVAVLGTSFNVKTLESKTEVIVETGLVEVENGGQTARVGAGEKIVLEKGRLDKQPVAGELHSYYRTGKLVCRDTPLQELVKTLNEIYDVTIVIENPVLQQKMITTVFDQKSLSDILQVIAETLQIKVTKTPTKIVLE